MRLKDAPSFDEVLDDLELQPSEATQPPKRGLRAALLAVVIVLLLALGAVRFLQSDQAAVLLGRGGLEGVAVDEEGQPLQVEVKVYGMREWVASAPDGRFVLENLPAGEQTVIIAYGDIAVEAGAQVTAGETTSLGEVVVPTQQDIE